MKSLMIVSLFLIFSIIAFGCEQKAEPDPRRIAVLELARNEQYEDATNKAHELFDNEEELVEILEYIDYIKWENEIIKEMEEERKEEAKIHDSSPSRKLEIQPEPSFDFIGNYGYLYGRVKNVSEQNINYFEVIVTFIDEGGQVLDSYYTYDDLKLRPGEMRGFEIEFRRGEDFERYRLSIGDVR